MDERDLVARYESIGLRLARLSRGQDNRKIVPQSVAKSISAKPRLTKTWALGHWKSIYGR